MLASKNLSSAIVPFEYAQKHLVFVAFSADVFETCNPFFWKEVKKRSDRPTKDEQAKQKNC